MKNESTYRRGEKQESPLCDPESHLLLGESATRRVVYNARIISVNLGKHNMISKMRGTASNEPDQLMQGF